MKHNFQLRKEALAFYLNGTSIRGIQRALGVCFNKKISFCVINNWIKNASSILEEERIRRKEEKAVKTQMENVSLVYVRRKEKEKKGKREEEKKKRRNPSNR
jgi:hypothetical protein